MRFLESREFFCFVDFLLFLSLLEERFSIETKKKRCLGLFFFFCSTPKKGPRRRGPIRYNARTHAHADTHARSRRARLISRVLLSSSFLLSHTRREREKLFLFVAFARAKRRLKKKKRGDCFFAIDFCRAPPENQKAYIHRLIYI